MSDHREAIAEVLAEHAWLSSDEQKVDHEWTWGINCECGEFIPDAKANAHVADALLGSDVLAHIRAEARAEALREAADDWQQGAWTELTAAIRPGGPGSIIGAGQVVTDWLRDRIEGSA